MPYMLCKNKVTDYAGWREVFDSHAEAQRKAGLHVLYVLREIADPDTVVMLFRVDDLARAKAFTGSAKAAESARVSGVVGVPELSFLTE